MSKKNRLTPNQEKYAELQKRLKRKLRDVGKRGFVPNTKVIKPVAELPKIVRKKDIEKIEKQIKNIYDYVKYYDPVKDTYISGEERRKQERVEAARKGWEKRREKAAKAERDRFFYPDYDDGYYDEEDGEYNLPSEEDLIIQQVEDMISNWEVSPKWSSELQDIKREDKNLLRSVFTGAINTLGKEQVARNIQGRTTELLHYINEILYQSGNKRRNSGREGVRYAVQQCRDIFYGRASTVEESRELTELAEKLNESE